MPGGGAARRRRRAPGAILGTLLAPLLGVMASVTASAGPDSDPAAAGQALARLNEIRRAARLPAFARAAALERAAAAHAAYLSRNVVPGQRAPSLHHQQRGRPGFTGETPAARALAAGYPHRRVSENVSARSADAAASVNGLMTAIYHRLAFLDPVMDEVGIAAAGDFHVFVMGRSDYRAVCRGQRPEVLYEPPAQCLGNRMDATYLDALCGDLPEQARFAAPWPESCPDGTRLRRAYMESWCESPPDAARFEAPGRYRLLCDGDLRVDADWWRQFCASLPEAARYRHSGSSYRICDGTRRVHARWWERFCGDLPDPARYQYSGRYAEVCRDDTRVHFEWLGRLDAARWGEAPGLVRWPPPGWRDAQPAFYDEQPDPLPDQSIAGAPVSLQLDPERWPGARMAAFRLYAAGAGDALEEIAPLRILDRAADPNGVLEDGQWALFAPGHLGWGRDYVAEVALTTREGERVEERWRFRTRDPGLPVLEAGEGMETLSYPQGRFLLFLPPTEGSPRPLASFGYRSPRGVRVQAEAVDLNTLRMRIDGRSCAPVTLEPDGRPPLRLRARGCPNQG